LMERVYRGEAGRAGAVKAKCYDCVGHEDLHARVGHCASTGCPLHAFRPIRCSHTNEECDKLK
jgi:hypothetical protein